MTMEEAKLLRNDALAASDKLVLRDFPITPFGRWKAEDYRQKLRDWPESAGFPDPETMPQAEDWGKYKPEVSTSAEPMEV